MMNVNPVLNILVVFYSLSGCTKKSAEIIKSKLEVQGCEVDIHTLEKGNYLNIDLYGYDLIFIGSPTYGKGGTPKIARDFLRHHLKDKNTRGLNFCVFGNGDTQFGEHVFCRATDEIEFHLNQYGNRVLNKIKIEQNPVNKKDVYKIEKFVEEALKEEQQY